MNSLMKYISRTYRCAGTHRGARLNIEGLGSCQHIYLYQVCRHPGISQEQLSRRICVNKSNVARQAALLEKNGFIRREADPADRRALRVYPTERALSIVPAMSDLMREWDSLLLEGFNEDEKKALISMLERVANRAAVLTEQERARPGENEPFDQYDKKGERPG